MSEREATEARKLIDSSMYLTLATVDEGGQPWASPLWFAHSTYSDFLWVSKPDARHSQNLVTHPEVAIVIFDSTVSIGAAQAVYLEAVGEQVHDSELERWIAIYSGRSVAVGAGAWSRAEVSAPASLRLYRAAASAQFVLAEGDRRVPVTL